MPACPPPTKLGHGLSNPHHCQRHCTRDLQWGLRTLGLTLVWVMSSFLWFNLSFTPLWTQEVIINHYEQWFIQKMKMLTSEGPQCGYSGNVNKFTHFRAIVNRFSWVIWLRSEKYVRLCKDNLNFQTCLHPVTVQLIGRPSTICAFKWSIRASPSRHWHSHKNCTFCSVTRHPDSNIKRTICRLF